MKKTKEVDLILLLKFIHCNVSLPSQRLIIIQVIDNLRVSFE